MRYRFDPPYPDHARGPGPARDVDIRASDAERTEVADRLSRHFADGRLDQVEFKARLDRAMGATTRGDLGGLFDDLPALHDEAPPPRRRHRRLVPVVVFVVLAAVVVGSTLPMIRVPWVLLVVIGLLVWHRAGRHHRRGQPLGELDH